jgi:hypothetical protein
VPRGDTRSRPHAAIVARHHIYQTIARSFGPDSDGLSLVLKHQSGSYCAGSYCDCTHTVIQTIGLADGGTVVIEWKQSGTNFSSSYLRVGAGALGAGDLIGIGNANSGVGTTGSGFLLFRPDGGGGLEGLIVGDACDSEEDCLDDAVAPSIRALTTAANISGYRGASLRPLHEFRTEASAAAATPEDEPPPARGPGRTDCDTLAGIGGGTSLSFLSSVGGGCGSNGTLRLKCARRHAALS